MFSKSNWLGITFVVFGLGVASGMLLLRSEIISTPELPDKQSESEVGSPCDVMQDMTTAKPGYQCYYYDAPDGSRKGVWIIPDFFRLNLDAKPLPSDWKYFESPGGEVSFSYPPGWFVNTENYERDGSIFVQMGGPSDASSNVSIDISSRNPDAVESTEDWIAQDVSQAGRTSREGIALNGVSGEEVKIVAPASILENFVKLSFDRGDHHVFITAPIYADFFRETTEILLSSMRVR